MVLESLINPWKAKKHPWKLFLIGLLFAVVGVIFSLWVFESHASIIMVLLVVLMSVPLMYATMVVEEETELKLKNERSILREHAKTIGFLTLLFLGFVAGFTLCYVFLPDAIVEPLFSAQTDAIQAVNSQVTGDSVHISSFFGVLANNLKVLIFCIVFAFFFGAGAIFILSWNASVIAAAIGQFIREGLASVANSAGFVTLASYFTVVVSSMMRYLIHGILEIGGYFVGGLAGGIISVGLMRHGFSSKEFNKVLYDGAILLIIALLILVFAGIVEIYITPILFY